MRSLTIASVLKRTIASEDASQGFPWAKDWLGPPANPDYWKFVGDELYLFEACQAEYQFDLNVSEAVKMGKDRWHSWFGDHFFSHMAMNTESTEVDDVR